MSDEMLQSAIDTFVSGTGFGLHLKIFAYEVEGSRHDTGNKLGYLQAVVYFALRRPDLSEPFRAYLRSENIERRSTFRTGTR